MSYKRSSNRSLGSLRQNGEIINARVPLPPLKSTDFTDGMIVSPMSVPPQKSVTTSNSKKQTEVKPKLNQSPPHSSERSDAAWEKLLKEKDRIIKDREKEVKDKVTIIHSKEQQVKQQQEDYNSLLESIRLLEQECKTLKDDIREKENELSHMHTTIDAKASETDYKSLFEKECRKHEKCQLKVATIETQLEEKCKILDQEREDHRKELNTLQEELESKHAAVVKEKDKQINERDEKINKMKKQMADAFTGSSWERQQQLDELTKELSKVQNEAESLRYKLNKASKDGSPTNATKTSKGYACPNCISLSNAIQMKEKALRDKDSSIDELNNTCMGLESQLKQQEEQLKKWSDVKGRVLIFDE